jgi:hypothetical protein
MGPELPVRPKEWGIHPAAPHGFDNQLDTPRTREVREAMLAFLHAHLDAR